MGQDKGLFSLCFLLHLFICKSLNSWFTFPLLDMIRYCSVRNFYNALVHGKEKKFYGFVKGRMYVYTTMANWPYSHMSSRYFSIRFYISYPSATRSPNCPNPILESPTLLHPFCFFHPVTQFFWLHLSAPVYMEDFPLVLSLFRCVFEVLELMRVPRNY